MLDFFTIFGLDSTLRKQRNESLCLLCCFRLKGYFESLYTMI